MPILQWSRGRDAHPTVESGQRCPSYGGVGTGMPILQSRGRDAHPTVESGQGCPSYSGVGAGMPILQWSRGRDAHPTVESGQGCPSYSGVGAGMPLLQWSWGRDAHPTVESGQGCPSYGGVGNALSYRRLSRKLLMTTVTLLNAIANAANTGCSARSTIGRKVSGYNSPAATGMRTRL